LNDIARENYLSRFKSRVSSEEPVVIAPPGWQDQGALEDIPEQAIGTVAQDAHGHPPQDSGDGDQGLMPKVQTCTPECLNVTREDLIHEQIEQTLVEDEQVVLRGVEKHPEDTETCLYEAENHMNKDDLTRQGEMIRVQGEANGGQGREHISHTEQNTMLDGQSWTGAQQVVSKGEELTIRGRQVESQGNQLRTKGEQMRAQGAQWITWGEQNFLQGFQMRTQGEEIGPIGEEMVIQGVQMMAQGEQMKSQGKQMSSQGEEWIIEGEQFRAKGLQMISQGELIESQMTQVICEGDHARAAEGITPAVEMPTVKEENPQGQHVSQEERVIRQDDHKPLEPAEVPGERKAPLGQKQQDVQDDRGIQELLSSASHQGIDLNAARVPPAKRPHANHFENTRRLEPVFQFLAVNQPNMKRFLPALQELSGVPQGTLARWRGILQGTPREPGRPDWRPGPPRGHVNFGMGSEETLDGILKGIIDARIREKLPVTFQYVRGQAIAIFRDSRRGKLPTTFCESDLDDEWNVSLKDWEGDDESDDEDLQEQMAREIVDDDIDGQFHRIQHAFSDHWVRDWIRRHGYSLRMAHSERRSSASPDEKRDREAAFRIDCRILFLGAFRSMRRFWWNMDETKMMFMMPCRRTIAPRGAEGVTVAYSGDAKASLTIMAFVNAAGEKGPVVVIARGTTLRCEEALRAAFRSQIAAGKLVVFHQKRSWVDEEMALKFLDVLNRQPSAAAGKVLVWDVFAAHRTQAVKDYAASLKIALKYIPAGQTGDLQPLDRRIFGDVKGRVGHLFLDRIMRGETVINAVEAMKTWLAAWNAVDQEAIIRAWEPILGELVGFD
jgi:hypothetical protein